MGSQGQVPERGAGWNPAKKEKIFKPLKAAEGAIL